MLEQVSIGLVGAGGIIGQVAEGLARKGTGQLVIADADSVTFSNLNRQFFTAGQVGKNKAHALASSLGNIATAPMRLVAVPWHFPDERALAAMADCQVFVCGVDNDQARKSVATWCFERNIPLIVMAVTYNADFGYCFVQEPGGACYGCFDPDAFNGQRTTPCVVGSAIDVLKVVGGLGLYAIDSLLMDRPRSWNLKEVALDGDRPERQLRLPKSPLCPLCGTSDMADVPRLA